MWSFRLCSGRIPSEVSQTTVRFRAIYITRLPACALRYSVTNGPDDLFTSYACLPTCILSSSFSRHTQRFVGMRSVAQA